MSRIRSIHPGFFRDEDLVACSAFARLLFVGLGVEADDKGIFEWKPVQLKMTIFPADNVDVAALLAELVEAGNVRRFDVSGKAFGAIHNFRKYQRPKTPNSVHPMPSDIAEYVAFPHSGETPTDDGGPFPPKGEKSPQMEEVGGKREEEDKSPAPVLAALGARDLFNEVWETFPQNHSSNRAKAASAFEALTKAEKPKALDAARRYLRWFGQDCEARKRTEDAGLRYVPHLSTWLETGAWREADALPIKGESTGPVVAMIRVDQGSDPELFAECGRVRGKPTPNSPWSFTVDVVDTARAQLKRSVAA